MASQKTVVEEVAYWLKLYDDGSVDRTWSGPSEAEFMVKPVRAQDEFNNGVAVRDLIPDPKSGLGGIRLYLPERNPDDEEKLPILVHFHGGGFCISQPEWYMYYHFYTRLVHSARVICVSAKLRLAPEHRLPAACEDGHSVLLWLRAVAHGKLSEPWLEAGDFKRVFLIGDSSGGNLVHEVAARAGFEDLDPVQLAGGIPIHAGFVQAERSKSELEKNSDSPFLTLEMVDKLLKLALPIGSTKDHPITCPMGPAAPPLADLKLPPFLVALAENDLMVDTQKEYCDAMKKAGKDVEVLISQGVSHSFYLNKMAIEMDAHTASETDRLIGAITDFIKRH